MQKITILLIALMIFAGNSIYAGETSSDQLENLLDRVKQAQYQQQIINQQREDRFLQAKKQQKQLVYQAEQHLQKERMQNDPIAKQLERNKAELTVLQNKLQEEITEMGDIYSLIRQHAGDYHALFEDSLISAQYPQRNTFIQKLAEGDSLATLDELQKMWFLLQQEMVESGRIVRFEGELLLPNGETRSGQITRIGSFTAISEGNFLSYLPANHRLLVLPQQPPLRDQQVAANFEQATTGILPLLIDPTRGSILKLLVDRPSLLERIQQGKEVGFIIISLGIIGLLMTLYRLINQAMIKRKIKAQLNNLCQPIPDNPLGRVLAAGRNGVSNEPQNLELKLDDAILKEIPALERGQSLIKLLAAVAPLLGLLGTVIGMISTFQAITLFGTGDPKLMAGGISQALVTTVLGLVVAIPLLFGHNLVSSRSKALVQILDEQSAGLLARSPEANNNV